MMKSVKIETVFLRIFLIVAGIGISIAVFFFSKWCFANAIATHAPNKEIAELAVSLGPQDPQSHYALAILQDKNFSPESTAQTISEFERAVALAPNDYRLWLALGKARERNGDVLGAESAVRKSIALAPNYAQVQWTLGNILLRHDKGEEGFAEMVQAATEDLNYRLPVINTAWQVFNGDLEIVRRHIGNSPNINSALALFLAKQKRFNDATQIWNSLRVEDKNSVYKTDGEKLFSELIIAKKYRSALQVWQSLSSIPSEENFTLGKFFNGGFEKPIERGQAQIFDWQISDGTQPQIGLNEEQKSSGERSLLFIFNSFDGKDFRQISQTIAVESQHKYILEFFYKSDLKTSAPLRWEIIDVADNRTLAVSNPISENPNWTNINTEFTTSATTEAVIVRLTRENCKSIICSITGKIWFDDFSIK